MDLEQIFFVRTPVGDARQADLKAPMAAAFRHMLRALDGKRSLADLAKLFPQLDADDLRLWISELVRQKMIRRVPALSESQRMRLSQAPAGLEQELGKVSAEIGPWLATISGRHVALAAGLARTARLAALEANTAASRMGRAGYFLSAANEPRTRKIAGGRVLVVEDDKILAEVIGELLKLEGYQARLVHSGADAWNALGEAPPPDLMVLDIHLPDISGIDLLERVRARPAVENLKVLLITGRASNAEIAKGVLLGAAGYLAKPFRPEMLKITVQQLLGG